LAKNDVILLDGILDGRALAESSERGELFELFAFEQILKSFDLSREEIECGWVDGKDDGGIDGFYTFVNGTLIRNVNEATLPRRGVEIEYWIISCKHKDSFNQDPINTIFPTIEELLNFTRGPEDFSAKYSKELLSARQIALGVYHKTASSLPSIKFSFAYACRGDISELEVNIAARGNQIERIVAENFSAAKVKFTYVGASELVDLHRQSRTVLQLPYSEQLTADAGAYVLLVDLQAYSEFVTDEHGNLKRYLFDSNVRDFLGKTRVNHDIAESLESMTGPDFWWLNNGVTILATSSRPLGKTSIGNAIQLHDVQIVNGLQTTQSIYQHFKCGADAQGRKVLVKIVVSEDTAVRDQIIEATNNQNPVELAALNATDRIQRDIEQVLERSGWYYERRKNYYKNIGKPAERFVTPLSLAISVICILKRAPSLAGRLRQKFMRNQASYESVFSSRTPLTLWPKLAEIIKWSETSLGRSVPIRHGSRSRMQRTWRGAVVLCAVAELNGTFNLSNAQIEATDMSKLPAGKADQILSELLSTDPATQEERDRLQRNVGVIDWACIKYAEVHKIAGGEQIGCWSFSTASTTLSLPPGQIADADLGALIEKVLPQQPWGASLRKDLMAQLELTKGEVFRGLEFLQKSGKWPRQRGACVLDKDGTIQAIDPSRDDGRFSIGQKYKPS
jgi:hypothetical protein